MATPLIYLDAAATTPPSPPVLAAMRRCAGASPGEVRAQAGAARADLAARLGCTPERLVVTSGATAANGLALRGVARAAGRGAHIIAQPTEHPSVLRTLEALAEDGCRVGWLPVDREGRVEVDAFASLLRPETALVSTMAANHETGVVQPCGQLGARCRAAGVLFHVDAVQAARYLPVDLASLNADLLSISGHKLNGPRGIGALACSGRAPALGTPPVDPARVVGLAAALAARVELPPAAREAVRRSRDALEAELLGAVPGAFRNGADQRLPGHLSLCVPGLSSEALVLELDLRGVAAASGSACASGSGGPSPVLLAMGRSRAEASASLRFTLPAALSPDDRAHVVQAVAQAAARLRGLAPTLDS